MSIKRNAFFLISIVALAFFMGCNSYSKLLKSNDVSLKYKAAEELYEKADYQRALPLLEDIFKFYIGTPQAEKIDYMLAYSYYKMGEFSLGAFQFKNFAESYPLSTQAEEARYYYAYCLYLDSPQKDLDQSSTQGAINAFQLYIDKYPNSKHVDECNKNIDILTNKLEQKAIDNAVLYYNILNYKSAVWAIRNVLVEYPTTKEREHLEYIIVKSTYLYAENSIDEKKIERYSSAIEYYNEFKEKYPKSKYDAELTSIVKDSNYRIQQIKIKQNERQ